MILLDTHVWLWLLHNPSQLSSQAQAAIDSEEPQSGLLVSTISVWEIAIKFSIGKLTLPLPIDEWYSLARTHSGIVYRVFESSRCDRQYTTAGQFS
ncbi:type II toxin-antitoxin system VapC family toxin [Nostoc sp. ATCC 53789]|uniref:type II toxin-antitoxin system VapC family toxin n=1 Tax=Nostoc sp. ATCC 53789 TaxID=76335 RepID=UPI001FD86CA7|nr:type II toxin-antitoxin system VapC family toxin [Nostoc sp. ATCC 53789]